jgi:hypothetical protein
VEGDRLSHKFVDSGYNRQLRIYHEVKTAAHLLLMALDLVHSVDWVFY